MPQLDICIISSQIFWLLIKFCLFFLVLSSYIPAFSRLLKARHKVLTLGEKVAIRSQRLVRNGAFNIKACQIYIYLEEGEWEEDEIDFRIPLVKEFDYDPWFTPRFFRQHFKKVAAKKTKALIRAAKKRKKK